MKCELKPFGLNFRELFERRIRLPQQWISAWRAYEKNRNYCFCGGSDSGSCDRKFFSFGQFREKILHLSSNSATTAGSGNLASETRDEGSFEGIDVDGVFQVEITAQDNFGIDIEADDNLLPLIKTEVSGGVLHIESESKISSGNPIRVKISAPNIESIEASGLSKVAVRSLKNSDLKVNANGVSKINIEGETANLTIDVSGASHVDTINLKAEDVTAEASGASHVSVFATYKLHAEASGASKIVYSGNPKNIEKSTSGASSVREK